MKASELKPGDVLTAISEHFSASITVGSPYYVQRIENGMISFLDNDLITVWINENELNAYFTWRARTIESILKEWGFVEDEDSVKWEYRDSPTLSSCGFFAYSEFSIWKMSQGSMKMPFPGLSPTNLPHVLEALGVEKGENNG